MERKLASVQIISEINTIEGADMIEVATVKSWKLVCKKGEFAAGSKAVYCEIDSFLPLKPEFEFLRRTSYKKMGDTEGFRLRTVKMRGQVSQGLLLPMSVLPANREFEPGDDVTELLGILKYEPPVPAQLAGIMRGGFPSFLQKTDEERIQNLTGEYEAYKLKGEKYYVTEKLDGSSVTFYLQNNLFGVCSRNLDLLETEDNTLWKVARSLDIENKLRGLNKNFALQGECIGEGVQGNPYKLRGQTVRFFNAFDTDKRMHLGFEEFIGLAASLSLQTVPVLATAFTLPATIDELLQMADGKSALNSATDREGIVIRSHNRDVSFKVISNKFLLNEK